MSIHLRAPMTGQSNDSTQIYLSMINVLELILGMYKRIYVWNHE